MDHPLIIIINGRQRGIALISPEGICEAHYKKELFNHLKCLLTEESVIGTIPSTQRVMISLRVHRKAG